MRAIQLLSLTLLSCTADPGPLTVVILKDDNLPKAASGSNLQELLDSKQSPSVRETTSRPENENNEDYDSDDENGPLQGHQTILDMINGLEPDENGQRCLNKTMLRRETEYEEIIRCDHSYDERCHTTYVTSYVPHYEEECEEKFRKVCVISYEQKAVTEMVEECTTPLVPDCDRDNIPEVCRIVYDTVCDTKQETYEVEEQFPNCTTVNMEKNGEVWPVQQCSLETRMVTHSNPRTECRKEPRELCAPGDCPLVEVQSDRVTVRLDSSCPGSPGLSD